ncbi:amidohydrolase family protein [Agrobacterium sp. 22-226-1]
MAVTDSVRYDRAWLVSCPIPVFRLAVIRQCDPDLDALQAEISDPIVCGIKLNTGFLDISADDNRLRPLYRLAAQYRLPVAVHTGDPGWSGARLKYCHPMVLDDVAKAHRETSFIMTHSGNPWIREAAVIAANNPNIVLECSSLIESLTPGAMGDRSNLLVCDQIKFLAAYLNDPSRIIFGSGWPDLSISEYAELVKRSLPKSWWEAVFFTNAMRTYRLNPSADVNSV